MEEKTKEKAVGEGLGPQFFWFERWRRKEVKECGECLEAAKAREASLLQCLWEAASLPMP